ncbi:RNA polymerase sigma factor [Pedobacter rhodius]|uniref:Sigma-70 family RNA polymerase sigma factor n=1 Tax=Pedobacter rhodius TaxID=3004098 RepID=A0ABT4KWF4_9SPHI|nr:sigma-70 family RNA polymerase sigma factor [Pedobacter sp. SJ11]MCZ4223265.1 sigma-70 family RNA polymerase sigma factor [Pedobacter sp. SJ11]
MTDYTAYSDLDLAALLRKDDDKAFREVYLRYQSLLFRYAFNKLGNEEEAKDVIQDVFFRLLRNKEGLILNTTLSGYLYKSVLNQVFDIFRHRDIVKKYIDMGEHYIEIDAEETDYLIREKDFSALIDLEVSGMPPRMREIYDLKRKQFLSTKQIAQQLGISEHTVSNHLKKIAKHLKGRLGLLIYLIYILNQKNMFLIISVLCFCLLFLAHFLISG